MKADGGRQSSGPAEDLGRKVGHKAARKLAGRNQKQHSIWFGLGLFGLVGWSVAVPTLIGIAVGLWLDKLWPGRVSWTITLLIVGVGLGCLNAWRWIQEETKND